MPMAVVIDSRGCDRATVVIPHPRRRGDRVIDTCSDVVRRRPLPASRSYQLIEAERTRRARSEMLRLRVLRRMFEARVDPDQQTSVTHDEPIAVARTKAIR
jgi:hypothetical protein